MQESSITFDNDRYIDSASSLHRQLIELLTLADIRPGGNRPWDLQLKQEGVFERVASRANVGLGEAYMDGCWDVEELDEFFFRLLRARLDRHVRPLTVIIQALRSRFFNLQTMKRAWQVGEEHYDLGNEFYQAMLDPRMTYTCGYWKGAVTLAEAQEAKLDLI